MQRNYQQRNKNAIETSQTQAKHKHKQKQNTYKNTRKHGKAVATGNASKRALVRLAPDKRQTNGYRIRPRVGGTLPVRAHSWSSRLVAAANAAKSSKETAFRDIARIYDNL